MRVTWVDSGGDRYYYLSNSVRDGKKVKTYHVKKLGKLSELGYKNHDEAITELRKLALEYNTNDKHTSLVPININIEKSLDKMDNSKNTTSNITNIGYLYLDKIYDGLGLSKYMDDLNKDKYKFKYDIDKILKLLVYSRILFPSSKKKTHDNIDNLFGFNEEDINLENIYRSLDVLNNEKDEIQKLIYENSKDIVSRDTKVLYYDCTNFFFEREYEDLDIIKDDEMIEGLRKYGVSKENRPNPIVTMGLFIDRSGIPLAMSISPGNKNENTTTIPLEERIIKDYKLSKFIYSSDAGLGSMDTRLYNSFNDRAYIITRSIKKLSNQAKDIIFDDNEWKDINSNKVNLKDVKNNMNDLNTYYKVLDYYEDTYITLKNNNNKKKETLKQKLVVTYSNKYKEYQSTIRNNQIERAKKLINNGQFDKENINSPKRFIIKDYITYGGEKCEYKIPRLDINKINEESHYDGYYAVITNLIGDPKEIIEINRNRWEIEESFRIMKTNFLSRPTFVYKAEHIKAHFLTCFISLVIYRILEKKLDNKYTVDEIIDNLKKINVLPFKNEAVYKSVYNYSEFIETLDNKLSIRLSKEAFLVNELKKYLK